LANAEACYRDRLLRHREWVMERKVDAETELKRQKEEAERKARELQEKARERIERLLLQAKDLNRANQIRADVEATLIRAAEMPICCLSKAAFAPAQNHCSLSSL
jgi:cytochrome c biogenesis protein ResB